MRSELCKYGAALLLGSLMSRGAAAEDLLACAPGTETKTALAICAVTQGGCAVASQMADDVAARRFLLGEACTALASSITGEGYDVPDFLGAGAIEVLDAASRQAFNDDDPDNDWIGWIGSLAVGVHKVTGFAQCVEAATHKCVQRWSQSHTTQSTTMSPVEAVRKAAQLQFESASSCKVEDEISLYDSNVYYEGEVHDIEYIRSTKSQRCAGFSSTLSLAIRGDQVSVSDFQNDSTIKIADYDVDFYADGDRRNSPIGTTSIRLVFRTDTSTPRIIGELRAVGVDATSADAPSSSAPQPAPDAGANAKAALTCSDDCPYFSGLYANDTVFRQSFLSALKQTGVPVQSWLTNGTGGPVQPVVSGGRQYLRGSVCEPHNCGHSYTFLYLESERRTVGLYNSIYGQGIWFGEPSDPEKKILADL
jgi:hypothetical protein